MTTQTPTREQAVARKSELDALLVGKTLRAGNGDLFTVERIYRRPNTPSDGPVRPWVAEGELRALVFDFYDTPTTADAEGTTEMSGKKKFVRQSVNDQTPAPAPRTRTAAKKCEGCGTRPIDRSTQGKDSIYCTGCYEYAGWENTHDDNGHEIEEAAADSLEVSQCPVCHPDLKDALYEQAAPKPRASKTPQTCRCSDGCASKTNKIFAQGHDARMVSLLVKAVKAGQLTEAEAVAKVRQVAGQTTPLAAKLTYAINKTKPVGRLRVDQRVDILAGDEAGSWGIVKLVTEDEVHVAHAGGEVERVYGHDEVRPSPAAA